MLCVRGILGFISVTVTALVFGDEAEAHFWMKLCFLVHLLSLSIAIVTFCVYCMKPTVMFTLDMETTFSYITGTSHYVVCIDS